MADKIKRPRMDNEDKSCDFLTDEKVAQCLSKYQSTVFACETSADTRYIKCDFPSCSKHSGNKEGKPPWILNTLRNVKILERHVGKEVAQFMKENLPQSFDQNPHLKNSQECITSQSLRPHTKKVLVVFNLADPQSLLGEWIALFLNAAVIKYGHECCDVEVITQSYTSRYELLSCVTKLEFIRRHPNVDVIAMLSCHSSSQGQVFSCTPSVLSRCYKYEEFCSLHDFVQILQDTLGQSLSAIHVSSCFTLKLDCSHQDWPVDVEWLNKKLHCALSGSTKEVYETGSQVADLYVSLSALLNPIKHNLGDVLKDAIHCARVEAFPDLAQEMGLEVLCPQDVGKKASSPCINEEVSAPGQVNSFLHVVILVGYDSKNDQSHETHQALAHALAANLSMRKISDVRCKYSLLPLNDSNIAWRENLCSCIRSISNVDEKIFFVALGSCWTHHNLLDIIQKQISSSNRHDSCYGIHFQEITSMQAYFLKSQLCKINSCSEDLITGSASAKAHIVATGLVQDEKSNPIDTFPVLLYLVHLAIGENGERISGKSLIPAHLKYKQYKGPAISHWTLEDVYMETSYVLSGLARKAGLCLLSLPKINVSCLREELCSAKTAPVTNNHEHEEAMEHHHDSSCDEKDVFSSGSTSQHLNCIPCSSEQERRVTCYDSMIYASSKSNDLSDVENCAVSCLYSGVNNCSGSTVSKSRTEKDLLYRDENISDTKKCEVPGSNSKISRCSGSILGESGTILLHHDESLFPIKESAISCLNSEVNNCSGSTVGESGSEKDLLYQDENISDMKKYEVPGSNSAINDCSVSTVGMSNSGTTLLHHNENHSPDKESAIICLNSVVNSSGSAVANSISEAVLLHQNENIPGVGKCIDSGVIDWSGSTLSESKSGTTLLHQDQDYPDVNESTASYSYSVVNDCGGLAAGKSSSEADLVHQSGKISDVKNCIDREVLSDCSGSTVIESKPATTLPHRAENNSDVKKCTVCGLSSRVSNRSCLTVSESKSEATLLHEDEQRSNVNICTASGSNFGVSYVTSDRCDNQTLLGDNSQEFGDEDEYVSVTDDESDRPCSQSKWDTSDDLPLMANVDEVLVTHYVLNLSVNFNEKVMSGDITLFLKPATELVLQRQFQLCLDCSLVDIESVEEIDLKDDFSVRQYGTTEDDSTTCSAYPPDVFQVDKFKKVPVALPYILLPYAVRNWCVRIWKPYKLGRTWPRCVRIKYCTRPEGKSLTWTTDQDNRPCVFSPGAYINNRSLMPCQEPPIAMSTWQAAIHVPKGCTVLMSGDELPVQNCDETDVATFLYEMNVPLPCSTLALAIGWFECRQTSTVALSSTIQCRVFSAASVINETSQELLPKCTKYVTAACELLGPYPFNRMDLVILPRCFACMGLMSPNMAFLSQSILARDGSMCTRVAHEISHSWFGLLIGAKDWSEEWLSEGFATYMEERILCKVEGLEGDEELFYVELHQIIKHRTLMAEFQHADENMQRLRPNLPRVVTAAEAVRQSVEKQRGCKSEDVVPHTTVTNGQVCSKKWTQIYYLKGYFLLHYMASLVGKRNFDHFLKDYVLEYGGKLVNSEEFFDYFERRFTSLREENIKDRLIKEWLERHGLPVHVPKKIGRPDNHLINQVESEFGFWKKTDAVNKRKKTQHIRSKTPIKDHPKVDGLIQTLENVARVKKSVQNHSPSARVRALFLTLATFPRVWIRPSKHRNHKNDQIQLVVLLERLLERDAMATATLTQLENCYHFAEKNAEVRHRWCELIVKHRYNPGYPEVKRFLIEDQGMGIYLFGELLISQQPKQKQLVLDVLSIISAEMDQCTLKTVQDMLEGRD